MRRFNCGLDSVRALQLSELGAGGESRKHGNLAFLRTDLSSLFPLQFLTSPVASVCIRHAE